MSGSTPLLTDAPICLEAAKRRLVERVGMSRSTLHKRGHVDRLKAAGMHLNRQYETDGSVKLRDFRIRPSAVDAVAEGILRHLPDGETVRAAA